jgi:hypothetical protein
MQSVDSQLRCPSRRRPPALRRIVNGLRARVNATGLDRELADGAPPGASRALELRARALSQPAVGRELGHQLRRIVRQAHQPTVPGTRVKPRRERVLAAEPELQLLASRLQSPRRPAVAGIAKVRVLLSDGCGPLYYRHSEQDLGTAIREATSALT